MISEEAKRLRSEQFKSCEYFPEWVSGLPNSNTADSMALLFHLLSDATLEWTSTRLNKLRERLRLTSFNHTKELLWKTVGAPNWTGPAVQSLLSSLPKKIVKADIPCEKHYDPEGSDKNTLIHLAANAQQRPVELTCLVLDWLTRKLNGPIPWDIWVSGIENIRVKRLLDHARSRDYKQAFLVSRGMKLVLINQTVFTDVTLSQRREAEEIGRQYVDFFRRKTGIEPMVILSSSAKEIREFLAKIPDTEDCSGLFIMIMSHGGKGFFCAADGLKIRIKEVRDALQPCLLGCPKVLVVQTCRKPFQPHEEQGERPHMDAGATISVPNSENEAYMMQFVQGTPRENTDPYWSEFYAARDGEDADRERMPRILCSELMKMSDDTFLSTIFKEVMRQVRDHSGGDQNSEMSPKYGLIKEVVILPLQTGR